MAKKRRGPKPRKELLLAREVVHARGLPKQERPTLDEIAKRKGITRRSVERAFRKRDVQVSRERDERIAQTLTARLDARDSESPAGQQAHDDALEARTAYEAALRSARAQQAARRARKKRPTPT